MTNKQIAELFSAGQFEVSYPYLSENIEWNVFGEKMLQGKKAVIEDCLSTKTSRNRGYRVIPGYGQSVKIENNVCFEKKIR